MNNWHLDLLQEIRFSESPEDVFGNKHFRNASLYTKNIIRRAVERRNWELYSYKMRYTTTLMINYNKSRYVSGLDDIHF